MKTEPKIGDYVLATLNTEPLRGDDWCVGFLKEIKDGRYYVADNAGNLIDRRGLRRCERISQRVGTAIWANREVIEQSCRSVWFWRKNIKHLIEIGERWRRKQ